MFYTASALKILSRRYRLILLKCALLNAGLFFAASPALAERPDVANLEDLNELLSLGGSGTMQNSIETDMSLGSINASVTLDGAGFSIIANGGVDSITVGSGKALTLTDITFSNFTGPDVTAQSGSTLTISNSTFNTGISNASSSVTLSGDVYVGSLSGSGTVTNSGTLYLTGASSSNTINGGGTTVVDYDGTTITGAVNQAITINESKKLNAAANLIGGAVNNSGTLNLTGNTLSQNVTGTGTTTITSGTVTVASGKSIENILTVADGKTLTGAGSVTALGNSSLGTGGTISVTTLTIGNGTESATFANTGTISSTNLTVSTNATLNTSASNIGAVTNNGTLNLTAGTLTSALTNNNAVTTTGAVSLANVSGANGTIENSGTLTLTGTTNTNVINGSGSIVVNSAGLTTSGALNQNITINASKQLNASADLIGGDVTNNGTLNLSGGMLSHNVSGSGTMSVATDTVSVADGKIVENIVTVANNKILTGGGTVKALGASSLGTDGTISVATLTIGDGTNSATFTNSGTIAGTTTLTVAANATLNTSASNIGAVTNNGTLNLSTGTETAAITNNNAVTTTGAVSLTNILGTNGTVTLNASSANATLTLTGKDNSNTIAATIGEGKTASLIISNTGGTTADNTLTTTGALNVATTINAGARLSAAANLIGAAVTNNGVLALTGGTLANAVTGAGTTTVETASIAANADITNKIKVASSMVLSGTGTITALDGSTNDGSITADLVVGDGAGDALFTNRGTLRDVTVAVRGTLNTLADNIGATVTNNGVLQLTGGTLSNAVTGTGETKIETENVVTNANITNKITVAASKTLTGIGSVVALNGSTNAGDISTALTVGNGSDAALFTNLGTLGAVTVAENGTLKTNAGNVGTVTNNGVLQLAGGTLTSAVLGTGETMISLDAESVVADGNITNKITIAASKTLSGAGTVTALDGSTNAGTISAALKIGNGTDAAVFTNTGTLGAVTVSANGTLNTSASSIGDVINNGTLALNGGETTNAVTNNGLITVTGDVAVKDLAGRNGTVTLDASSADVLLMLTGTSNNNAIGFTGAQSAVLLISNAGEAMTTTGTLNVSTEIANRSELIADANLFGTAVTNNGTLTLTGNTLGQAVTGSGTTSITGDVSSTANIGQSIVISNGASLEAAANLIGASVTNNGTLSLDDGALAQVVSGSGKTEIIGDVSTTARINQNVEISETASLSIAANLIGGALKNDGALMLTGGALSQVISGEGTTTIAGNVSSTTSINQEISISSGHSLRLSADLLGNRVTDNGTLTLTGGTLAQDVLGTGNIVVSGNVNISGRYNDFTGKLSVSGGELTVTALTRSNSELEVESESTLHLGEMRLEADTVSFKSGSVLNISLSNNDGTIKTGVINAANTLTAESGAVLNVSLENFTVKKGSPETVTLLTAGSSVTDDFTLRTVKENYVFERVAAGQYMISNTFSAGEVVKNIGGSENNISIADAWDHFESTNSISNELSRGLVALSEDSTKREEYKQNLIALAPEEKPMIATASNDNVRSVFNAVDSRLSGLRQSSYKSADAIQRKRALQRVARGRSGGSRPNPNSFGSVWGQGLYNYARFSGKQGFETNMAGGALGADFGVGDFRLGFGSAYTSGVVDGYQRETNVKSYTGFLYTEYQNFSGFYLNAAASYGVSEYEEEKKVLTTKIKGNYDVATIGAQASMGWEFSVFSPEIGVRYTRFEQEKYTDTAGQSVGKSSGRTVTGVVGAKVSRTFELSGISSLEPMFKLSAAYDFKTERTKNVVTLSNGTTYEISGENMEKRSVETGVGLTYRNGKNEVAFEYEGRFRKRYQEHTGMLNFKYNF